MTTGTLRRLLFVLPLSLITAGARASTIDGFAVLGNQSVTNTGPTTIVGNIGVSPGTSITGFGSITLTGTEDIANSPAQVAQSDALTAYNTALGLSPTATLTGEDLGTLGPGGLAPGVYFFASSAQLTGTLLLNAGGTDTASWIFQIGSTLTTASGSNVEIINSGSAGSYTGNIVWQVGSSATLGTTTNLLGDIIADASVTLNTGATIGCGGAIALGASVTLDNNTIDTGCTVAGSGSSVQAPASPIPEPGTFALLSPGLLAMVFLAFRKSRISPLI